MLVVELAKLLVDVGLFSYVDGAWQFSMPGGESGQDGVREGEEWRVVAPTPPRDVEAKVLFDKLKVSDIHILASLRINAPSSSSGKKGLGPLDFLSVLGSLDHVPFKLGGVAHTNVHHSSWRGFTNRVLRHYSSSLILAGLTVIGSLDLFFAPLLYVSELSATIYNAIIVPLTMMPRHMPTSQRLVMAGRSLVDIIFTLVFVCTLLVHVTTTSLSRLLSLLTGDQRFVRTHAVKVFGRKPSRGLLTGLTAGFGVFSSGVRTALKYPFLTPLKEMRATEADLSDAIGATNSRILGLVLGIIFGIWRFSLTAIIAHLDLLAKVSEGLKNFFSPRDVVAERRTLPRVIWNDGRLREYDEGEARAFYMLSQCSGLQQQRQQHFSGIFDEDDGEYYLDHHSIDIDGGALAAARARARDRESKHNHATTVRYGNARLVEHVLLVTSKRVVFGTTQPLHVIFEVSISPGRPSLGLT